MNHIFRTGLVVLALAPAAMAQGTEQPIGTPVRKSAALQCRTDASTYQNKEVADLRLMGKALTVEALQPIIEQSRKIARDCADRIRPDTIATAELGPLASVYIFSGDTAKAQSVVAMTLSRPGMTEAERADAYASAEGLSISTFDAFRGYNADAERFVRAIDSMSDAVLPVKIRAHQALLGRYEYADYDDGLRDQATKLLKLAQHALETHALGQTAARPGVPAVDVAYPIMVQAYSSLARAAGDFLHPDSALMILDEAERIVGPVYPPARAEFEAPRAMYRLVGTKATPITAKWWINGKDGAKATPASGKVTLIQFTAHWCVPCRHSYPGTLNIAKHFTGKPFEAVMETYLYGFIGGKQKLAPEQEVAEDRDYYIKQHGLPFRIAVNPQPADSTVKDNSSRYAVGGIPEIVVVDKKGTVRATIVGWDNGNEARLTKFIEQLLAEK